MPEYRSGILCLMLNVHVQRKRNKTTYQLHKYELGCHFLVLGLWKGINPQFSLNRVRVWEPWRHTPILNWRGCPPSPGFNTVNPDWRYFFFPKLCARERSVASVKCVRWGMMVFLSAPALKLVSITSASQCVASLMANSTTMNVSCVKKSALPAVWSESCRDLAKVSILSTYGPCSHI